MEYVKLAVNGTLMRGLPLASHLTEVGAVFFQEQRTARCYRLWSIGDDHPAMLRVSREDPKAVRVEVEVWQVPPKGLAGILMGEPEGLTVGKVLLETGETVLGVLGEPEAVKGEKEISEFGGWRAYLQSLEV